MSLTQVYTAIPNDVISAARWNNEFGNIYNNGTSLVFPLTQAVSFAGFTITVDSSGQSTLTSTSSQGLSFSPGNKSGTPNTTGKVLDIAANTFTDTNTAGSGVAASFAGVSIQRPTLASSNTLVTTTDVATLYIANAPAAGTNETLTNPYALWIDDGNTRLDGALSVAGNATVTGSLTVSGAIAGGLVAGKPIGGLTYANSAGDAVNDITVAVGEASTDDATLANRKLMVLASAITKQLDATWAVGTNAGGLDTGSIGNSDYYIWLIMRTDLTVVDVLFSLSSTAPAMPASYTFKRLIGYIKRVGAAMVLFTTYETEGGGVQHLWSSPTTDISLAATLTTARRTDAVKVPITFSVIAHMNIVIDDGTAAAFVEIYCPDQTDLAPSLTVAPLHNMKIHVASQNVGYMFNVRTSSTGTIAARSNTATIDNYYITTLGFSWARRN